MIHEEEHDLLTRLDRYLHSWGLREFHDESSYFAWQRTCLNQQQLLTLEGLINRRSKDSTGEADIDFTMSLLSRIFSPFFIVNDTIITESWAWFCIPGLRELGGF